MEQLGQEIDPGHVQVQPIDKSSPVTAVFTCRRTISTLAVHAEGGQKWAVGVNHLYSRVCPPEPVDSMQINRVQRQHAHTN